MKDLIIKNIHIFIILLAAFNMFELYEEKDSQLIELESQKPAVVAQINRSKVKLKQIEKFKKNLTQSKKRVKDVLTQLEKVQKQLPGKLNATEVQQTMTDISDELKMLEPNPSPADEKMNGFYFANNYVFEAKGTFLQFLIFFEKLSKTKRILNVNDVTITTEENVSRSRFQILKLNTLIESYRFNAGYKEKTTE